MTVSQIKLLFYGYVGVYALLTVYAIANINTYTISTFIIASLAFIPIVKAYHKRINQELESLNNSEE